MKFKLTLLGLFMAAALPALAQTPVYLDTNKSVEERVKDALTRMTLEEKVAMIHAQSKFSSPGVPRLGIPEVWTTDGPHGIRPEVLWDKWNQAGWTNDSCIAFPAMEPRWKANGILLSSNGIFLYMPDQFPFPQ